MLNHLPFDRSCDYKDLASARLENVTQTIARILEGYDIRLRPNFGGKYNYIGFEIILLNKSHAIFD